MFDNDTFPYSVFGRPTNKAVSSGPTQVRVTIKSSTSGTVIDNVSIGIQSTTYNTALTPVELLFSGGHGVTLGVSETLTSDWATLTIGSSIGSIFSGSGSGNDSGWINYSARSIVPVTGGFNVIVIIDTGASGGAGYVDVSGSSYYQASSNSYNVASPSGSWTSWGNIVGIVGVETQ
jgi:hypothetical protein